MDLRNIVGSTFCVLVLVIAVFAGLSFSEAMEDSEKRIVLVRDVEGMEDISSLKNSGEIIDHYGNYVLLETREGKLSVIEEEFTVDRLEHRNELSVKGHRFDMEEGMPEFSDELTIEDYEQGKKGLYLVNLFGPVNPEWRSTLELMDIEMIDYVPNYAYEVFMTPEQAEEVEKYDFVNSVEIYQPGFKLARNLEPGEVSINFVDGSRIITEVEDESAFVELARRNDVYFISNYLEPQLHGEVSSQNIGGGHWIWDPDDDPDEPWRGYNDEYDYGAHANHLGYSGEGLVSVVADTGIHDIHQDFQDRVIGGYYWGSGDDWTDGHGHGTHCAGSVAGDTYRGTELFIHELWDDHEEMGDYYGGQGLAYGSELYSARIFDDGGGSVIPADTTEVVTVPRDEVGPDAYIHSNSWGSESRGAYGDTDSDYDSVVRDAGDGEPMVITVSAGNAGEGPDYQSTGSPGNAKNVITIGASEAYYPGWAEDTDDYEADPDRTAVFSSRGWTEDGRVKPDVMAPGMYVISTYYDEDDPERDDAYAGMGGTSMSNPAVAGAAGVIVEWYEDNYGVRPSPAMVKALMINTAYDMEDQPGDYYTGPIPNRDEGWGMVDLQKVMDAPVDFMLEDQTSVITTGEEHHHEIEPIDLNEPMKVSLVWTDSPAEAGADPALRNDLNLEIDSPMGDWFRGNGFPTDGDGFSTWGYTESNTEAMSPFDGSGDGWDDRNNVQNVYIHPDDLEDGTYTVNIMGENIPDPVVGDGQDYALVMYNAVDADAEPGPLPPSDPDPADGSGDWSTDVDLSVHVEHDEGEDMDVSFYDADDHSLIDTDNDVASGDRAEVTWSGLDYGTTYQWYAVAEDDEDNSAQSSTWSFTTMSEPGPLPPMDPDPADGSGEVSTDAELSVHVEHEENEDMDVEFYDEADNHIGTDDNVASGERAEVTWSGLDYETTYQWYAIAEDDDGTTAESDTWSFTTQEEPDLLPPTGFRIEKDENAGDLIPEWDDMGSPEYNVYYSEDRFADLETWDNIATVETTQYTHENALGGENYYFVTSTDGAEESDRSSIAFCVEKYFDSERPRHYISVPMGFEDLTGDGELTASDLVMSIEGDLESSDYISDVVKWDYMSRGYSGRYYYDDVGGEWTDDFVIEPGDGIGFAVENDFTWHVNAADTEHSIVYGDERPRHYTSIPYTLADQTGDDQLMASDLVMMIEGDLESSEYIFDVVKWDHMNRGYSERYYYDDFAGEWTDDFVIEPGDGVGFAVKNEFTFEVELVDSEGGQSTALPGAQMIEERMEERVNTLDRFLDVISDDYGYSNSQEMLNDLGLESCNVKAVSRALDKVSSERRT